MSRKVLIDSAVPIYALGGPSPWQVAARRVLKLGTDGRWELFASTEMVQEVVFHRMRITGNRGLAIAQAQDLCQLVRLIPFDQSVLDLGLRLMALTDIRGRDAVHAASALTAGLDTVITPDPDFDGIPGLTRLDLAEAAKSTT